MPPCLLLLPTTFPHYLHTACFYCFPHNVLAFPLYLFIPLRSSIHPSSVPSYHFLLDFHLLISLENCSTCHTFFPTYRTITPHTVTLLLHCLCCVLPTYTASFLPFLSGTHLRFPACLHTCFYCYWICCCTTGWITAVYTATKRFVLHGLLPIPCPRLPTVSCTCHMPCRSPGFFYLGFCVPAHYLPRFGCTFYCFYCTCLPPLPSHLTACLPAVLFC